MGPTGSIQADDARRRGWLRGVGVGAAPDGMRPSPSGSASSDRGGRLSRSRRAQARSRLSTVASLQGVTTGGICVPPARCAPEISSQDVSLAHPVVRRFGQCPAFPCAFNAVGQRQALIRVMVGKAKELAAVASTVVLLRRRRAAESSERYLALFSKFALEGLVWHEDPEANTLWVLEIGERQPSTSTPRTTFP